MEALALERKQEQNRELRVRLEQLKKNGMQSFWLIIISVMKFRRLPIFGGLFLLAQKAAETDAEVIVFCGVHFMGKALRFWRLTKLCLFLMNAPVVRWPIWSMWMACAS